MKQNILTYKGFIGSVNFSSEDAVFFGKIEGINDLVTFEGETVKELTDAFHYVVDEHIKDCKAQHIEPEKSYKGSFNIRISPDLHRQLAISAKLKGKTLNSFVAEALSEKVHPL